MSFCGLTIAAGRRHITDRTHRSLNFVSLDNSPRALAGGIGNRYSGNKLPRIGVLRIVEHGASWPDLDDFPEIHHGDAVAHPLDDRHVVRNEQIGEIEALLQVDQQVANLRLDRDVECGDGLVGEALSRWRRRSAMGLQLLKFQAAVTASRHVLIAAARKVRCVEAEVRWRWTLKVLKTAA
jgi:hypothetical protein